MLSLDKIQYREGKEYVKALFYDELVVVDNKFTFFFSMFVVIIQRN